MATLFKPILLAGVFAVALAFGGHASIGSWIANTSGNWSDPAKWAGGIVAEGAGNTAIFNTNITGTVIVTLDGNHTLGGLVFGGASAWNSNNWTISGSSTLALDNAGAAPTVTCWPLKPAGNSTCNLSIPLSGTHGFTMEGSGTLWLNGNNSGLSGTLTIASGRVFNYNANGLGSMNVSIATGSYLSFWTGGAFSGNFTLDGLGGTIDGQAKNTLYADNAVGANVILNGSVTLNATSDVGGSTTNASITFNGPVTGSGGLIKQTASGVILNGANSFTGGLTINAGTLTIGGAGQLGGGLFVAGITNNGILNYRSSAAQTLAGIISGSGTLLQSGPGTLTLSGANTSYGVTIINGGALVLSGNGSLGNTAELTIGAGGTLDVSARNPFVLGSSTWLNASGTGTVSGSSAAAIKAASGGTISLPFCPIGLTFDGQHPTLCISQGGLSLNGNVLIVNSSSPLAAGSYTIIKQMSGNILASGPFSVSGTAIGSQMSGSIVVCGGEVNLVVQNTGLNRSPTIYATWCMIWADHNQTGWWNPTNFWDATGFMGIYASVDWANNNYALSSFNCIGENGVSAVICDLTNGWGWLNSRVQYLQCLAIAKAMKICVAVDYQSLVFFETNQCADVWNLFAGPSAPYAPTYLLKDGKPVIVCYCIRSQFDALVASTGPNRQNFTLVWASGEDSNADKWGWQLVPSAGAIASTNSVFVTSSIKWNSTIPDSWRKSQAWLDYSFSVANRSQPAFVIVGSFDDIPERNAWLEADTTGCTNGMQMHDITGRINSTNYYHRVHQWILGTPSANPGGYVPDGCYVVTNLSSGKSLNMPNSVGTNYGYAGLQLVQSTPGTSLDNYFMFYHLGTNIYRIISLDSGLALEAPNNNAGAQIAQDWESTGTSQRWTVVYAGNGSYYLQNQASGKVLDVGRAITNGAPVLQNSMTNGVAGQQWTLGLVARIGSPPPPLLTARQAGEAVRLSWPLGYASYTLQKQSGISGVSSGPGAWLDVAGVVSNSYSEPLTNLNCFYRLKSQ